MPDLSELLPGEKEKAKEALAMLPAATRGFYVAHYQILGSKPEGTFMGLVCRVCDRWQDCGHSEDCPVSKLEKDSRYYSVIRLCREEVAMMFPEEFREEKMAELTDTDIELIARKTGDHLMEVGYWDVLEAVVNGW